MSLTRITHKNLREALSSGLSIFSMDLVRIVANYYGPISFTCSFSGVPLCDPVSLTQIGHFAEHNPLNTKVIYEREVAERLRDMGKFAPFGQVKIRTRYDVSVFLDYVNTHVVYTHDEFVLPVNFSGQNSKPSEQIKSEITDAHNKRVDHPSRSIPSETRLFKKVMKKSDKHFEKNKSHVNFEQIDVAEIQEFFAKRGETKVKDAYFRKYKACGSGCEASWSNLLYMLCCCPCFCLTACTPPCPPEYKAPHRFAAASYPDVVTEIYSRSASSRLTFIANMGERTVSITPAKNESKSVSLLLTSSL